MTGLVIGPILTSFSPVMVKLADVPPDVAGFYRLVFGGLGMLAFLWHRGDLRQLTPHVWKWSVPAAVFFAADFFYWHRSIDLVGPGISTLLANFQVIVLTAASVLFFRERPSAAFLLAMPLALAGLYMTVGVQWAEYSDSYRLGVVYGLLTAAAYALYLLSLKFSLSKVGADPLAMAGATALVTGAILGGMAAFRGDSFAIPDVQSLTALAALAFLCHAVGWFLITRGLQQVRASMVGLILLLQPALSYVWDVLFFAKPTTVIEASGVVLALVAIYLGSLRRK